MLNNLYLRVASVFVEPESNPYVTDNIFQEHREIIQWLTERNCKIKVDRVREPVRFGWVYHLTAEELTREIYLEYQLTWK